MKKYSVALLAAAGLLAGCNQSIESASKEFNELPPAVQKTVRAQMPSAEIADVSRRTDNGVEVYEVTLRHNDQRPKVVVAADGKLISTDLPSAAGKVERLLTPTGSPGTPLSALPVAVQRAIQSRAPEAAIANISREEENGRTIYKVEFADQGANPTLRVAEDGTLVQDLQK